MLYHPINHSTRMVTIEGFSAVLEACSALLPYGKALPESAFAISWATFPEQARHELTDADLAWAAGQYLQDPRREAYPEPVHLAILRYLYRLGDGRARLEWGIRWPNGRPDSAAFCGSRVGDEEEALQRQTALPALPEPPPVPRLAAMVQDLAAAGSRPGGPHGV
jgi:hypothetical protein